MKKILYIISYIPLKTANGPQGPKNLTFNLLKYLSSRHELDLLILSSDDYTYKDEIIKEFPDIKTYRHFQTKKGIQKLIFRLISLIKGYPLSLGEYKNRLIESYIKDNYQNYHIVHYDYFMLANLLKITSGKVPSLLYSHDAYSLCYTHLCSNTINPIYYVKNKIKELSFRHLEANFYGLVSKVITVSDIDTNHLIKFNINNVETVPIPVGDDFYNIKIKSRISKGLLIVAPYFTESNISLAKKFIYKYLDKLQSACEFNEIVVWGKCILKFPLINKYKNIKFIDYVEDYIGFLNRDWIYVYLNSEGSGQQTKLQEAMSLGLPVVGFSNLLTPLGAENGVHFYSCNSLDEIYTCIVKLAENPGKRKEIGRNAREFVKDSFNLQTIGKKIEDIYDSLLYTN